MGPETTCPICNVEHIPIISSRCPQCDSDLTCFRVLDSLPDALPVERPSISRKVLILSIGLFVCLGAVLISVQHFFFIPRESRVEEIGDRFPANRVKMVIEKKAFLDALHPPEPIRIRDAEDAREDFTTPVEPLIIDEFRVIEADDTDTLWKISEDFYGRGIYYPVILEHNPHVDIYGIGSGTKLKILQDPEGVPEIYKEIAERRGSNLFWRYTVTQGDTLQSIAVRFHKTEDGIRQILELNPALELKPGERIIIRLE